jgi:hypothetical protein
MTLMERRRAIIGAQNSGGARLPAEYQEVEYIGYSTSHCNIWTGIACNAMTKIVADIAKTGLPSTNKGSIFPSVQNAVGQWSANGNYWGTLENINGSSFTASPSFNKTNTFTRTTITSTNTGATSLTQFVGVGYNSATYCPALQFYSIKIYNGDVLLFDGVPCYRKSDNMIGLYDVVGNYFCLSNGAWSKGADVV